MESISTKSDQFDAETKQVWVFNDFLNNLDELIDETLVLNRKLKQKPEHYDKFSAKLLNNPYYFCSWADGAIRKLKFEQLFDFLDKLFEYIPRPRHGKEYVKIGHSRMLGKQTAVAFFVEAYIKLQITGRLSRVGIIWKLKANANVCNEGGKKFGYHQVRKGFMDPEYLPGIEYLHKWGRLHIMVEKGSVPLRCDPSAYDAEGEFMKLPNKSKAILEATKMLFWSALRSVHNDARALSIGALRKIVKLDPGNYEWNYQLANWARMERRTNDRLACISEEEMNTLWETYDKCQYDDTKEDKVLRGMAFFGVLQGIAELLKFRLFQRIRDTPLIFGELKLENDKAARKYVLTEIRNYFEESQTCTFAESIRAGEILSSLMPVEHRDYAAAEKYYLRAWRIMPRNSKINHKLGTLYATADEVRDVSKALWHLRFAYEEENHNIPAALDFVHALLILPADHAAEAEIVLDQLLKSPCLQQSTQVEVLMLKGALKFMTGNNAEALRLWILHERGDLQPEMDLFSSLRLTMRRFKWTQPVDFSSILQVIDEHLSSGVDNDDKKVLEKLRQAALTASNRQPFRQRANMNGIQRQEFTRRIPKSEGDRDDSWRSPREDTNSNESSDKLAASPTSSVYQPPARRYQQTYYSNNVHGSSSSFQNSTEGRQPRYNYQKSAANRSPSPTSWRK